VRVATLPEVSPDDTQGAERVLEAAGEVLGTTDRLKTIVQTARVITLPVVS
jgi:hypothetical protein